jgi:hypothetical protein
METDLLVIEDLGTNIMHHAFIDPIADYMELLMLAQVVQTCFLYKDPMSSTVSSTYFSLDFHQT